MKYGIELEINKFQSSYRLQVYFLRSVYLKGQQGNEAHRQAWVKFRVSECVPLLHAESTSIENLLSTKGNCVPSISSYMKGNAGFRTKCS